MSDPHLMLALFEARSEALNAKEQAARLDDAIVMLADWMECAQGRLSEDDMAALGQIGAVLLQAALN